jgi:hypothetical protein
MFGLPLNTVLAIGVAICGLGLFAWMNRDQLPKLPKLPWFSTTTKKAKADRKAILLTLDDAYSYFEAEKCEEGKAAIKAAMGHVFHTEGHS